MREFGQRLVCDNCNGLLMTEPDLEAACADSRGIPVAATFTDELATEKPCPRCDQPMMSCHVVIATVRPKATVLRCAKHGVFLPPGVLGGLFARLGHGASGSTGHRTAPTQTGWNPYGG